MTRWITALVVLLVIQLGVALLLQLRRDVIVPQSPETALIGAALSGADRLVIESRPEGAGATRTELARQGKAWTLPGYFNAPADPTKVTQLLQKLAGLKRGLPIATTHSALQRFRVADAAYERRIEVTESGKPLARLYVGTSSGLRRTAARTERDSAVYDVDLPTYDVPVEPKDWFDTGFIRRPTEELVSIEVQPESRAAYTLVRGPKPDKGNAPWISAALGAHLDRSKADALVRMIADLRPTSVLGTAARPEWRQDHPLVSISLKNDQGAVEQWTLSRPVTGDTYVLKISTHPWYLSLDSYTGKTLIDNSERTALLDLPAPASARKHSPAANPAGKPAA